MRIVRRLYLAGVIVVAPSFILPRAAAAQVAVDPLPEVLVAISRGRCPTRSAEGAVQALLVAASRYDVRAAMSARLEVQARSERRRVSAQEVGQGTEMLATAAVRRGSVQMGRELWLGRLREGVFAAPLETSSFDGRHEAWEYPPLHGDLAYYFLTDDFVQAHDLSFLDDSHLVLGFCAKDRGETYIDGRIVMTDAGRIHSIDWAFRTSRLEEGAGGSLVLDSPLPLPRRGVYWRRLSSGDYTEWVDEYLGWSVSGL